MSRWKEERKETEGKRIYALLIMIPICPFLDQFDQCRSASGASDGALMYAAGSEASTSAAWERIWGREKGIGGHGFRIRVGD